MTDTTQAAAPTAPVAEDESDRIAKHELLAADGITLVDDFDEAHRTRYTDLESKLVFVWDYDAASEDAKRSLACFGARTLQTNTASRVRNSAKPKGSASGADQIAGIVARFALVESGAWVDRTRAGPTWDIPTLAQAAVNVSAADGKLKTDEAKSKALIRFTDLMTAADDASDEAKSKAKESQATIRGVAGVEAEYRRLRNPAAPVKSVDDLMAMVADPE